MAVDSTDPELAWRSLVRDLRASLGRHHRAGAWAAPGGRTARPAGDDPGVLAPAGDGARLPQVRAELGACTRCGLHAQRTQLVFGEGPALTSLMFIGESPSDDDDRAGRPFVGAAGELLDKMIDAMGWRRSEVYLAHVIKCRPPNDRAPQPDEVATCSPFLRAQIEAIAPRIIVALGQTAANVLLDDDQPLASTRGRFTERFGALVMPTFHPAELLRHPASKRETWADLKLVMAELSRLGLAPGAREGR